MTWQVSVAPRERAHWRAASGLGVLLGLVRQDGELQVGLSGIKPDPVGHDRVGRPKNLVVAGVRRSDQFSGTVGIDAQDLPEEAPLLVAPGAEADLATVPFNKSAHIIGNKSSVRVHANARIPLWGQSLLDHGHIPTCLRGQIKFRVKMAVQVDAIQCDMAYSHMFSASMKKMLRVNMPYRLRPNMVRGSVVVNHNVEKSDPTSETRAEMCSAQIKTPRRHGAAEGGRSGSGSSPQLESRISPLNLQGKMSLRRPKNPCRIAASLRIKPTRNDAQTPLKRAQRCDPVPISP